MKNSTKAACLLLAGCLLLACPISSHAQGQNQTSTNGDGQSIEPATNGQATNGNGAPSGPPSTPPPGAGPGAPPPNRRQCRSIATALQSYDFLSTLRAALVAAGMTDTLNEKDLTISFLAPTDAAFNRTLNALNTTAERLLREPLLLRRILQLHIIPVPLPSNVIARELRVPTLDFGSRLELRTRNGVTTVSASNSSEADIVDLSIADVCPPAQVFVIDNVLRPQGIAADLPDRLTAPPPEPESPLAGLFGPFAAFLPGGAGGDGGLPAFFPFGEGGGAGGGGAPVFPDFFGGGGFPGAAGGADGAGAGFTFPGADGAGFPGFPGAGGAGAGTGAAGAGAGGPAGGIFAGAAPGAGAAGGAGAGAGGAAPGTGFTGFLGTTGAGGGGAGGFPGFGGAGAGGAGGFPGFGGAGAGGAGGFPGFGGADAGGPAAGFPGFPGFGGGAAAAP
eukprot:jgi/Tetstr1/440884/TSEL_029156.t1